MKKLYKIVTLPILIVLHTFTLVLVVLQCVLVKNTILLDEFSEGIKRASIKMKIKNIMKGLRK